MSRLAKALLLLEVAVCFLPLTLLLLLGALMVPFQVGFLMMGELGSLYVIGAVLAGLAGLVALFIVLRWLLFRPVNPFERRWTLALMCLGILPVLPIAVAGDTWFWKILGAVPLLCSAHLAYLAREYLFGFRATKVAEPAPNRTASG